MTANKKIDLAERDAEVLRLAAEGLPQDVIAQRVGYRSQGSVSKALSRSLERHRANGVEAFRAMSEAQLDSIDQAAAHLLTLPGVTPADAIKALNLRRQVIESRAKILGHIGPSAHNTGNERTDQHRGPRNAYTLPRGETRPFFLVVDITDVPTELIPWDKLEVNPTPGEGTSAEWGTPTVGINAACTGRRVAARVALDGGLHHSGVYFRYKGSFEEIRNSDMLRYIAGDAIDERKTADNIVGEIEEENE